MSLWIPITLAAAIFQTVRFMLQKSLSTSSAARVELSAAGATFARFLYSAPLVVVILALYLNLFERPMPSLSGSFWMYGAVGGLAQILATVLVVLLFKQRNFAVGITFKKTEVIQTVLVGLVVLGEGVSLSAFAAILIGLVGVLLLSKTPGSDGPWWRSLSNRAAILGLSSGLLFAISGVTYRGATLELAGLDPLLRAGITLAVVTSMQLVAMALWLIWRDRDQITRVWQARRTAVWIGLTSMCGSICWFTAFTLQNAAYVNALGQIELILSLLASAFFFKEQITVRELTGIAVLGASIIALILLI